MCGILCLINHHLTTHPDVLNTTDCFWHTKDQAVVQELFSKKLKLAETDLNKLKYQDQLRALNDEIVRIGNDMKVDQSQRIKELRQEMKSLIGEEEVHEPVFNESINEFEYLMPFVAARGPDYLQYRQVDHESKNIQLFSSVLSLRQPFTPQPIVNERYILQFNGELYSEEEEISNDTEYLMKQIVSYGVEEVVNRLNGEYAFNVIDLESNVVYFGRDSIGKRSLCFKLDDSILISSNSLPGYTECEGRTLYKLKLDVFELETLKLKEDFRLLPGMGPTDPSQQVDKIHKALKQACLLRQESICPLNETEAHLAVLFSGGIDCTIIAAFLIENFIESNTPVKLDLLTVGFDNPRTGLVADKTPDRELSVKSWFHLVKKFQHKHISIRLIEINIDYELWLTHKPKVRELIYPQQTEMDLSISMAFYFASNNLIPCKKIELKHSDVSWEEFKADRGKYVSTEDYISSSKVLFSGLGADELFAGYSRHRVLFSRLQPQDESREQFEELRKLLAYDIDVIYKRNLGRDDRAISSWGKELRYPYLDVNFIKLALEEIDPQLKIKLEWNINKKGKLMIQPIRKWILRELAAFMGLEFVKDEEKRAIQFGSKSAKLEIGQARSKGTDELQ